MKKWYIAFTASGDSKAVGGPQCTKETYEEVVAWASNQLSNSNGVPSGYVICETIALVRREPVPVTVSVIR